MKRIFIGLVFTALIGSAQAQDLSGFEGLDLSSQLKTEYENSDLDAAGTYFFRKDLFDSMTSSVPANQAMSMRLRDLDVYSNGAFVAEGSTEGFVDYSGINAARAAGELSEYVVIADETLLNDLVTGLPATDGLAESLLRAGQAGFRLEDLTSCYWVYTTVSGERRCHWVCSDSSIFARALGIDN